LNNFYELIFPPRTTTKIFKHLKKAKKKKKVLETKEGNHSIQKTIVWYERQNLEKYCKSEE
jgi:hypothetical protein